MLVGDGLSLFDSTSEKTGGVQVEIEQVVLGFAIVRVQRNGLFETLAGFRRMHAGHEPAAGFRAAPPGAAQPKFVIGIVRGKSDGLLEGSVACL